MSTGARKEARVLPPLTPEQLSYVQEHYDQNVVELARNVYANPGLTLRNKPEITMIRQALAGMGKHVNEPPAEKEKELLQALTDEQKEYVKNNYKDSTGPLEIARTIFNQPDLRAFDKRCQMVSLYCKQLDPNYNKNDDLADDIEYKPPTSVMQVMARVNKYALNVRGDGKSLFDSTTLTPTQRQQLEALLAYMRLPLFKVEADKFIKRIDREVFESTFVATCWDKTDLSAEHVIQFIQLSSLIVKGNQLDRIAQKLDDRQNDTLSDPDAHIKMSEVETLNAYREKINAGSKQIAALIKSLTGERNKITDEKRSGNASMHNLVSTWKKQEDRRKIIQLAERKQKADLKKEVERLSSMDALKVEIFGLSKEDIVR